MTPSIVNLAMLTAVSAAPGGPRADEVAVYTVDLQRAVLATEQGRQARLSLQKMRRQQEALVRKKEQALIAEKKRLTREAYARRYEEIRRLIETVESKLEAAQQDRLAPILGEFRALIERAETPNLVILDISLEAPVGLGDRCDRTAPLIEAFKKGPSAELRLGPSSAACRFGALLYVDFDRLVKALPQSRVVLANLDELQEKRQAEIELQKKRLAALRQRADSTGDQRWQEEVQARTKQLDKTYRAYQAEIRQAEHDAQTTLYDTVEQRLAAFAAESGATRLLFVEHFDKSPVRRPRACEVSEWAAAMMVKQGDSQQLHRRCVWAAAN